MTTPCHPPFALVGAGIAGLTSALHLQQNGIDCTVFEKRARLEDDGAGIQISPNAYHVLANLGLEEPLREAAHATKTITVRSAYDDSRIVSMPIGALCERRFQAPYLVVHRAELIKLLHEACLECGVKIRLASDFTRDDYRDPQRPLIAADGIWSKLRAQVNQAVPNYAHRIAYRAVLHAKGCENFCDNFDTTLTLGDKAHFVSYPINGGAKLNLVCIVHAPAQNASLKGWSTPATPDDVLRHLRHWSARLQGLVQRTTDWEAWPLYTVRPDTCWHKNNTLLIGDAAHAMVPFLAQGGAMAIEDAAILCHSLKNETNLDTAFKAYEKERKNRVIKIWREAVANGKRYHLSGVPAKARNFALSALGGTRLAGRYSWIYEWRAPS